MLTKNELATVITDFCRVLLPEEFPEFNGELCSMDTFSGKYTGLRIRFKGINAAPVFNMDSLYASYESGASAREIAIAVAERLATAEKDSREAAGMTGRVHAYENVRDRLFVRLCGKKGREDYLKNVLHRDIEDLALTCHVMLSDSSSPETRSFGVTGQLLKEYGISEEQLFKDALENSAKIAPPEISTLPGMITMLGGTVESAPDNVPKMFVVTNAKLLHGASALFYPGMLDRVAHLAGGRYYLIPSSVHEMIAIPVGNTRQDPDALAALVREVNMTTVAEQERLSDSVYMYDPLTETFSTAAGGGLC